MSVTAVVNCYVKFSGDQENDLVFATGDLEDSPAMQELVTLATGDNTVTVPDIDDFTLHGLVIVPPSLNTVEMILKGLAGDTGVGISASRATVVQFGATPPASIVVSAFDDLVGVRLIWF